MTDTPPPHSIELQVEVSGTPEEVWEAIATGPGITSWYVPHTVEERAGGAATASFGPGPEMQIPGRVAAWEPPHRIVFDGGEGVPGLAFEWMVEARNGGTCIVRLVNTGFGSGNPWDDQYDDMKQGWLLFLTNLQLHCQHFPGQFATPILPMAMWVGTADQAWVTVLESLGLPLMIEPGTHISTSPGHPVQFAGTVLNAGPRRLALLLDEPCPGTAFLAAEGTGNPVGVSMWAYFYGPDQHTIAAHNEPLWRTWLEQL